MAIATINPATGETLKTYEPLSDEALEDKLARAAAAWATYRLTTPEQRVGWLRAAADVLDEDTDTVAELMTTEMGKTLASAKAEVGKCAKALRWYAEHGPALLEPRPVDADAVGRPGGLRRLPAARRGAGDHAVELPALAGDAVRRPGADGRQRRPAQARQQRAADRAVPGGAVPQGRLPGRRLPDPADRLGHDRAGAARRPGGRRDADRQRAGRAVGGLDRRRRAQDDRARARRQRPVHRHAVGATWTKAAEVAVTARCQNNGQSCIAAKRFFVHADVAEEFTRLFAEKLAALTVGDPMDRGHPDRPAGHRVRAARTSRSYVQDAVDKGATVVVGGKRPDGPGWFYPPTLLTGITPGDGPVRRGGLRPGRGAVHRRRASTRPSRSPTATPTGSAPTCGARTRASGRSSSATSPRAWRSSTA